MLKAININAPQAESITNLPDNTVLISINEEYEPLYPLKLDRNSSKILTVRFTDITKIIGRDGIMYHPIDKETTLKILEFIERNKDGNFIIHCAAGISRSSAVAKYISETYGHELKPQFEYLCHPNNYVLYMLREKGEYVG